MAKNPERKPMDPKKVAQLMPKKKKEKTSIKEYFKGVRLEMKKVVWPTKSELGHYTVVVIAACAFFGVLFWVVDSGFLTILKHLLGLTV